MKEAPGACRSAPGRIAFSGVGGSGAKGEVASPCRELGSPRLRLPRVPGSAARGGVGRGWVPGAAPPPGWGRGRAPAVCPGVWLRIDLAAGALGSASPCAPTPTAILALRWLGPLGHALAAAVLKETLAGSWADRQVASPTPAFRASEVPRGLWQ